MIIAAVSAGQPPAAEPGPLPPSREANEFICGPRCVQRVLEHYGRRVELIDLVRELQGAAIDRPANLADMKHALERRGVYAAGVKLRPPELRWLDWKAPVIAHFVSDGQMPGHFRVLLPPSEVCAKSWRVWDGLGGESSRRTDELAAEASGVLLLTSASAIYDPTRCLNRWRLTFPLGATAALSAILAGAVAVSAIVVFVTRLAKVSA